VVTVVAFCFESITLRQCKKLKDIDNTALKTNNEELIKLAEQVETLKKKSKEDK
jgi:hypothetical protein